VKASFLWLKEFVEFSETPQEIAALLLKQGFEVSALTPVGGAVSGVVVAQVESAEKHPNADKLKLCDVFDGTSHFQVVCGAPNVEAGHRYPFARLGARLPDGLVIEKRPLRGIDSHGMLCSSRELGLGPDHSGLYLLPNEAPLGQDVLETLALNDVILDVEVTPNRPDALSHWGLAREIAAGLGKPVRWPALSIPVVPRKTGLVRVEERTLCGRYVARVLDSVRVAPSPLWMRLRLERCGIRSINNVVDVTNYVLLELGHPLHVFDRARLAGGSVVVRLGGAGEKLECLDGVTRTVDGVLVIADGKGPVAAAGVMGGQGTGVGENTTSVLLESARFLPSHVRRSRGRLNVSTESSYRFERGTDFEMTEKASCRAAALIQSLAGGVMVAEEDARSEMATPKPIEVSFERLLRLLGLSVSLADVKNALESFGFVCEGGDPLLRVTPPLHRADVQDTPDIVEEVARRIGYDRIPGRVRAAVSDGPALPLVRSLSLRARDKLIGLGFWEAVQSGLVPRTLWDRWAGPTGENPVELSNPLSLTGECLNPSLLVNLLVCLAGNVRRGSRDARLFESARAFHRKGGAVVEADHIAWAATGRDHADHWKYRSRPLEMWDARAWSEALLNEWRLEGISFKVEPLPFLHPAESQTIWRGEERLGYFGRVHPLQAEMWALPSDTFVGEYNLSVAVGGPFVERNYRGLSRQPALVRDFSLVFPEGVPWASIVSWINRECAWVEAVELFDVFHGQGLPAGTRSLAFRVTFRHSDRTLTDEEAQTLHERVLTGLEKAHGAHLRVAIPS
jgi:phenylalanyl-tRNA synthetase beta chain